MRYKPDPIDTSHVNLPKDILALIEILAENMHDIWAEARMAEGWRYGPKRDDDLKLHPDLLPYRDLPEPEKDYDRRTALNAIKTVIALGFQISPTNRTADSHIGSAIHGSLLQRRLKKASGPELDALKSILPAKLGFEQQHNVEFYRGTGESILRAGEPLLAYDIAAKGLAAWPDDSRLKQILAMSLSRTGAALAANGILSEMKAQGHNDCETLGILGRTHKDLWAMDPESGMGKGHLDVARKCYFDAFQHALKAEQIDDGIYNGINAATVSMLCGRETEAQDLARRVVDLCQTRLERGTDYWATASLGKAAILLGSMDEAEKQFLSANQIAEGYLADLSTTRRQVRLLLSHIAQEENQLDRCFSIPNVVVFTGLMVDRQNRPAPRFPGFIEKTVSEAIASHLEEVNAGIGYASAACGSDILFLEAMLEQKGEINIVLPYKMEAFRRNCVDTIPGSDWGERFDKVLAQASDILIANDNSSASSAVGYEYANLLQDGLAVLHGQMLETDVFALAVWDRGPGDGAGGTASLVEHWQSAGRSCRIIDTTELFSRSGVPVSNGNGNEKNAPGGSGEEPDAKFEQEIMSMIFCDVEGYSLLTEEEIPLFVEHFMGAIEDMLQSNPNRPVFRNTWGDELHCVFRDLRQAGHFALSLRDLVQQTQWEGKGLPGDLDLRTSLHAGPVFSFEDPILKVPNYTGSHVSRASRMEAVTPPGEIYASRQYAAMASSLGIKDFIFEYVGHVMLPKASGSKPLYLVRKA